MRRFIPNTPKRSLKEICADYGLTFNPNKKFTQLIISDGEKTFKVNPKDENPFINTNLYKRKYETEIKVEFNFNMDFNESLKPTFRCQNEYRNDFSSQKIENYSSFNSEIIETLNNNGFAA